MGSQGLKRTKKIYTPNVNACAEIQFQMKISDLSASTPHPTKKLDFLQIQSSEISLFKLHSTNCIFKLQSPRFFGQIVPLQVYKILSKSPKSNRRTLAQFDKIRLSGWFWAFFFFWKKCFGAWNGQNKRIFVFLFSSIGKVETDKIVEFSNLSNSRFRSLIGWIQAIKLRKREFDRLEKIQHIY